MFVEHDVMTSLAMTVMAELSKGMWNLVLQLLKKLHLYYPNVSGHQTWHGGDFS